MENLIALPPGGAPILLQVNEFGDIVIPCRPTSPEIVPKLKNFDDDEEVRILHNYPLTFY